MCAFRFRLEPVVSLKKRLEDQRKSELAVARENLKQKETRLVNLCRRKETCQTSMNCDCRGSVDISSKLLYYAYMEKLTDEIADHASAVEQSKEDVELKRDQLLESSREKKALEKLRERMKQRYVVRTRRSEQAELDETASRRHGRKSDARLVWNKE
jgi:flagellar FliJ protein